MKKGAIVLLVICSIVLTGSRAYAENIWDMAESESYGRKAGGMFGRGLLNAATSPMDLIVQTVDNTMEGPPLIGTLVGLGSGLGCTALRASSGILDVATFWVPDWNGFTVSRSYHNCIATESKAYMESMPASSPAPVFYQETSAPQQPQSTVVVMQEQPAPKHNPMDYVKKGTMDEVAPSENRQQYIK